ncbi:hypothetical protein EYV94_23815 [Puteibacter caeruleilacunae]|nr:hypothetical protein EYV94_23815 [Puteibacter caeruleilacunae]
MRLNLTPYDLPDRKLMNREEDDFLIWQPSKDKIVLGQSNQLEQSVNFEEVYTDHIPVYKRPSGGHTVLLTSKTIVISVVVMEDELSKPHAYFDIFNDVVICALKKLGVNGLAKKGISDITIGDRKILGSSIYRSRNKLLYHAVLNVAESPVKIARYILHPTKEPDYRNGRDHEAFVTSLMEQGYQIEIDKIIDQITKELEKQKAG